MKYCSKLIFPKILRISALILCGSLITLIIDAALATAFSQQNLDSNVYLVYPKTNYNSGYPINLIKKGEYLTKAGDCIACHTDSRHNGVPYAGGYAINTPFGVIYTPNISPDKNTGIGNWTNAQFIKAMREGVSPTGSHYFPAFPFTSFTRVNDSDLTAIHAYLMSIPAINNTPPPNDMTWPFSMRFLQWGWKLLFFEHIKGEYHYDPNQSSEWNRGAYLVQGLEHCGECHSPRNILGAVKRDNAYTGAFVDGYYAPDITSKGVIKDASIDDVINVFLKGQMLNNAGKVQGLMANVNHDSLRYLSHDDLRDIVIYLKTIVSKKSHTSAAEPITAETGKLVYESHCDVCHGTGAAGAPRIGDVNAWQARLTQGINVLIQHAINGYNSMPPKGGCNTCSDDEIKAAVQYLADNSKAGTPK